MSGQWRVQSQSSSLEISQALPQMMSGLSASEGKRERQAGQHDTVKSGTDPSQASNQAFRFYDLDDIDPGIFSFFHVNPTFDVIEDAPEPSDEPSAKKPRLAEAENWRRPDPYKFANVFDEVYSNTQRRVTRYSKYISTGTDDISRAAVDRVPDLHQEPAATGGSGCAIDWDQMFREAVSASSSASGGGEQRAKLQKLIGAFHTTAKRYAKIIVQQWRRAQSEKLIASRNIGGEAGGMKFIFDGILFKLAVDCHGLYGTIENAQKSAGLELKAASCLQQFGDLNVPLMAIIDYRGFRVLAQALVPISADSLKYGSRDAARTIAVDGIIEKIIKPAAAKLMLKGHLVNKQLIFTPVDIEVHRSLKNNHIYVIDTARLFPPAAENRDQVKHTYLYQHLRPELVTNYHTPLSSDAFSRFCNDSTDAAINENEVLQATQHLLTRVLPNFARRLDVSQELQQSLIAAMHREGINVRYLGRVRQHCRKPTVLSLLLHEIVARTIKVTIQRRLRACMIRHSNTTSIELNSYGLYDKDTLHADMADMLNLIVDRTHPKSALFWPTIKSYANEKFVNALKPDEIGKEDFLPLAINTSQVLDRVLCLTGVTLDDCTQQAIASPTGVLSVASTNIRKVAARIKPMRLAALSEPTTKQAAPVDEQMDEDLSQSMDLSKSHVLEPVKGPLQASAGGKSLADIAKEFFEQAQQPGSHQLQSIKQAVINASDAKEFRLIARIGDFLLEQTAKQIPRERSEWAKVTCSCCETISEHFENEEDVENELYKHNLLRWARALVQQARVDASDDAYTEAGYKYRSALYSGCLDGMQVSWKDLQQISAAQVSALMELVAYQSPPVRKIDASKCYNQRAIDGKLLRLLCANYTTIDEVRLANCMAINDAALEEIFKVPDIRLRVVDLSFTLVGDSGLATIAARCSDSLEELLISGLKEISVDQVVHIIHSCAELSLMEADTVIRESEQVREALRSRGGLTLQPRK